MNKCFIKIARSKDEPGKGGFWRLDAAFESTLDDNLLKKKRLGLGLSKKSKSSSINRKSLSSNSIGYNIFPSFLLSFFPSFLLSFFSSVVLEMI